MKIQTGKKTKEETALWYQVNYVICLTEARQDISNGNNDSQLTIADLQVENCEITSKHVYRYCSMWSRLLNIDVLLALISKLMNING